MKVPILGFSNPFKFCSKLVLKGGGDWGNQKGKVQVEGARGWRSWMAGMEHGWGVGRDNGFLFFSFLSHYFVHFFLLKLSLYLFYPSSTS